jgi:hypothetical protein
MCGTLVDRKIILRQLCKFEKGSQGQRLLKDYGPRAVRPPFGDCDPSGARHLM